MKKNNLFLIIFLLVGIGELATVSLNLPAHYFFKPVIVLSLIGFYLSSTAERNSTLIRALFFCWVGDFVLMFNGELYFMIGLVAFLIGHVFYIFTFRQFVQQEQSTLLPTQKLRYTFPVFLAGTGLIVVLYPSLGALKIPVIIYATVLMVMVSTALMRYGRTNTRSFILVFAGAISFMLSDSLLALNKFRMPIEFASFYIMSMYILAQFLIVKGLLTHSK